MIDDEGLLWFMLVNGTLFSFIFTVFILKITYPKIVRRVLNFKPHSFSWYITETFYAVLLFVIGLICYFVVASIFIEYFVLF